jgi:hypothetical protein
VGAATNFGADPGSVDQQEADREAARGTALGGLGAGGGGGTQEGIGGDTAATNAGPTTGESTGGFAGIGQDTGGPAATTDPNDPTGSNQSPTLDSGLGTRVGGDVSAALSNAAPGGSPSVDVTNAANTIGQGGIASAQDVLAGDTPVAQALSEANAPAPAGQQPSTFNEQAQPGMFDAPTFSFGQNAPAPASNLMGPNEFGDMNPASPWPGVDQGQGPLGGPTSPTAPDPNTPSGIPGNMGQVTPSPDQSGFSLGNLLGISPAAAAGLGPNENLMPQGPSNPNQTMTGQGPTTETIVSPWDAGAAAIEPYPYTDQTNPQLGGPPATFGTIGNATGQGLYGELAGIVGSGPDPSLLVTPIHLHHLGKPLVCRRLTQRRWTPLINSSVRAKRRCRRSLQTNSASIHLLHRRKWPMPMFRFQKQTLGRESETPRSMRSNFPLDPEVRHQPSRLRRSQTMFRFQPQTRGRTSETPRSIRPNSLLDPGVRHQPSRRRLRPTPRDRRPARELPTPVQPRR